jgi:hypothetical protein
VDVVGVDGNESSIDLPTLGNEPFALEAFHALMIRAARGRAEVRVDGVVVASDVPVPAAPAPLGLYCRGPAAFDAVSITLLD